MTWNPQFNAVDTRSIVGNLIAFFEENQADALAWASPGRELAPLTCYPTAEVRILKDFPHMGIVSRRTRVEDVESLRHVTFQCVLEFELAAEHAKEDRTVVLAQLAVDVDAVGMAFESMALNIPTDVLYGENRLEIVRSVTGSAPLEAAVSETKSLFNTQLELIFQFAVPAFSF